MLMKFTDGVEIDTSGPIRIIWVKEDQAYMVTGHGFLCPVDSYQKGVELANELRRSFERTIYETKD